MSNKKVLVIIVAYNSMKWAERCYESLRASTVPCDVITIDNGSTDGTVEYIRQHYPEVDLRVMKSNLGFGRANNIGLQRVLDEGYDYAYLLNQDAWIMPDTIEKLISVSSINPDFGVLSPMQMKADGEHLDDRFATYVIGECQQTRPLLSEDLFFGRAKNIYETSFVMAAHWFITRNCVEQVGGFSPTFTMYGEDNNYMQRVRYWNLKIGIVPTAQAVHDRGNSNWSEKKLLFVENYTQALVKASNPKWKWSVWTLIRQNISKAIRNHNKDQWYYAVRLFKERNVIDNNYHESHKSCAFLHNSKK